MNETWQKVVLVVVSVLGAGLTSFFTAQSETAGTVPAERFERVAEYNCERNADLRHELHDVDEDLRSDLKELLLRAPLDPDLSPQEREQFEGAALALLEPGDPPDSGQSCADVISP